MRTTLVLVLLLATASTALGAAGSRHAVAVRSSVTGEITRLGPGRIAVGSVACSIPPRLAARAGRFVVGDPVRVDCLSGALRAVRYAPEVASNQTSQPGTGNAPTVVPTPAPACGLGCPGVTKVAYSVGFFFIGGGPTGDATNATGPITDISDGSLTAGGLTCSFRPFFDSFMQQAAHVGDDVVLSCVGGVFVSMRTVGLTVH